MPLSTLLRTLGATGSLATRAATGARVPLSTLYGTLGATEYLSGPDGWGGWDRNEEAGRVGPDGGVKLPP